MNPSYCVVRDLCGNCRKVFVVAAVAVPSDNVVAFVAVAAGVFAVSEIFSVI